MKNKIYFFLVLLLISLILINSFFIFKNINENYKQEIIFNELANISKMNDNNLKEDIRLDVNVKELYKINNDIIGWIKIEDTKLDYPIMQAKNNFYLRRNFYREYSNYGTPFISEYCNYNVDSNIIIYGHNMKNGKMFGELEKYNQKSFYDCHKKIKFYTLENESQYEIFSVFETDIYNKNSFEYYKYNNFSTEDEFNNFITECKKLSKYDTNIVPKYNDKLITLSTCSYSSENARLVVVARKVDF